jgi:hypothetical protein
VGPRFTRLQRLALVVSCLAAASRAQFRTTLSSETNEAFDRYAAEAESTMDWRAHVQPPRGDVTIAPTHNQADVNVPKGVIHDWTAAAIAPGATADSVVRLLQDYDNYKRIYNPQVTDSKLLERHGERFHAYLRLYKKAVVSVVLDSEYDIDYRRLDGGGAGLGGSGTGSTGSVPADHAPGGRWGVVSRSTRISEIDGGKPLAPGAGHGYTWRLNSYWLIEQRTEGVYLECRAITLSRNIPAGLGWVVKPFLTTLPRDALRETIEDTLRALK